jgi:hypothetical protein
MQINRARGNERAIAAKAILTSLLLCILTFGLTLKVYSSIALSSTAMTGCTPNYSVVPYAGWPTFNGQWPGCANGANYPCAHVGHTYAQCFEDCDTSCCPDSSNDVEYIKCNACCNGEFFSINHPGVQPVPPSCYCSVPPGP